LPNYQSGDSHTVHPKVNKNAFSGTSSGVSFNHDSGGSNSNPVNYISSSNGNFPSLSQLNKNSVSWSVPAPLSPPELKQPAKNSSPGRSFSVNKSEKNLILNSNNSKVVPNKEDKPKTNEDNLTLLEILKGKQKKKEELERGFNNPKSDPSPIFSKNDDTFNQDQKLTDEERKENNPFILDPFKNIDFGTDPINMDQYKTSFYEPFPPPSPGDLSLDTDNKESLNKNQPINMDLLSDYPFSQSSLAFDFLLRPFSPAFPWPSFSLSMDNPLSDCTPPLSTLSSTAVADSEGQKDDKNATPKYTLDI
jgi:hypothetical protein